MYFLVRVTEDRMLPGEEIPLGMGSQILGRLAPSTILVKSADCSPQHAEIIVQKDGVYLKDIVSYKIQECTRISFLILFFQLESQRHIHRRNTTEETSIDTFKSWRKIRNRMPGC
jgi:FHA domain